MRCVIFILCQVQLLAFATEKMIEVPDQCLKKQEFPCLIQSNDYVEFIWSKVHLQLQKNAIIEISNVQDIPLIHIQKGFVSAQSESKFKIFGYDIRNKSIHYVSAENDKKQILDSESFDLKTFSQSKEQNFVLLASDVLSRRKLILYLSSFYRNPTEFKRLLSLLLVSYQKKISTESEDQDQFFKKRQARDIASAENAEKQRVAIENQKTEDRKRSRELFFMRTFRQ
jgi:hypothetical protein